MTPTDALVYADQPEAIVVSFKELGRDRLGDETWPMTEVDALQSCGLSQSIPPS